MRDADAGTAVMGQPPAGGQEAAAAGGQGPTPAAVPEPTPAAVPEPTPAAVPEPTPAAVPEPTAGALSLILELARAEDTADPFGFRFAPQTYVLRQPGGDHASAVFPWDAAVLDDLDALQRTRPDPAARQRLGERLRRFLASAGWAAMEDDISAALDAGRPVHVTVRSSAAEMYALPWELVTLRHTGQHLGERDGCLIRYEWPGTATAAPVPDPPREGGRVLVAWSAAGGPVPAAEHVAAVRRACARGSHAFGEQDVLAHVSLQGLRAALDAAPVAVLHILCHGAALETPGEAQGDVQGFGLVWNGPDAGAARALVDAGALRQVLAPHAGSLRLVVLSACQGGDAGAPGNHLGSVAQALHRVGIPAVVASRVPLSVPGSIVLAEVLYERLLVDLAPLEHALLAARQRLAGAGLDWAALQLYARCADGPAHRPVVVRPYQGLRALTAADQRFFFGRDAEVEALVRLLRGGQRWLTLVGASGSGKSSLVLAGLVPRVQAGALGPAPATVHVMRPGARPGQALDRALAACARSSGPCLLVVDQLEELFTQARDPAEVAGFVRRLLAATADAAGHEDAGGAGGASRAGALAVVLTLRADFLTRCLELDRALAERIDASLQIVLPMAADRLRTVIVTPAARVGLRVDEAVVDALLDELRVDPAQQAVGQVGAGAGNLPLLAFALMALWEHRAGDRIPWAAWEAIGGLRGAIARRADQVLAACAAAGQQPLVRDLFSRLVQLGQGTEDTRRYAGRAELEAIAPGEAGPALQRWLDARLLAADEDEVWVAHEAVLRAWGTLRRWLDEDREALLVQQDVARAAQRWQAQARSADDLWRGDRLQRAQALRERGRMRLAAAERAFLDAGIEARRAAAEAAEAQRGRVLALAQQARRRARALALGAVIVAVVVSALGLWARALQREAEAQRNQAEAQQALAEQQRTLAEQRAIAARDASLTIGARALLAQDRPAWAMRLLLEVTRPGASAAWTAVAWEALGRDVPVSVLTGHRALIVSAAFGPDGRRVVTASDDGTARVWQVDRAVARDSAAPVVLQGHTARVRAATFSPDGRRVVTASDDGTARVWPTDGQTDDDSATDNAIGSAAPVVLRGHGGPVRTAAFSPDGRRVVTASDDGTARVWPTDGQTDGQTDRQADGLTDDDSATDNALGSATPVVLRGHHGPVRTAAFSPDGRRVVTASDDGTARVWQADGGASVVLRGHEGPVWAAAFSPDGRRVVTRSADGTARVWQVDAASADGSAAPVVLRGHESRPGIGQHVYSAAFSPDGARVVTAGADGTARVWQADGGGAPVVLRGHEGPVWAAAFSPDGRQVVTASWDGTARVWRADGSGAPLILPRLDGLAGDTGRVMAAAFDPDGRRVVTASWTQARVWDFGISTLQRRLRDAGTDCLPAVLRQTFLGESATEAEAGHRACTLHQP